MTGTLALVDVGTASDLRTFVARAAAADREGAMRLQAQGTVLAAYAAVLPGSGLAAEGLVMGLRTMRLAEPADLDVTVSLGSLLDRFAHDQGTRLAVPPTEVRAPWAGQSAPRAGWVPIGRVTSAELHDAAQAGIAEVARGVGSGAGALAVAELRHAVWARPMAAVEAEGIPSGLAFGAHALGFLTGEAGTVHRCGRWLRLSVPAGHVLAR